MNKVLEGQWASEKMARADALAEQERRERAHMNMQQVAMKLMDQMDRRNRWRDERGVNLAKELGAAAGMAGDGSPSFGGEGGEYYTQIAKGAHAGAAAEKEQKAFDRQQGIQDKQNEIRFRQAEIGAREQKNIAARSDENQKRDAAKHKLELDTVKLEHKNEEVIQNLKARHNIEAMADEYLHKGRLKELEYELDSKMEVLKASSGVGPGGLTRVEKLREQNIDNLRTMGSNYLRMAEAAAKQAETIQMTMGSKAAMVYITKSNEYQRKAAQAFSSAKVLGDEALASFRSVKRQPGVEYPGPPDPGSLDARLGAKPAPTPGGGGGFEGQMSRQKKIQQHLMSIPPAKRLEEKRSILKQINEGSGPFAGMSDAEKNSMRQLVTNL